MKKATLARIAGGRAKKGDVLGAARIAGILAAKRTHELVPLCHPLPIQSITIDLAANIDRSAIEVEARVRVEARGLVDRSKSCDSAGGSVVVIHRFRYCETPVKT